MNGPLLSVDVAALAPAGSYLALRVGFAFPLEEVNRLPPEWVDHYTAKGLMLADPAMRWIYANTGAIRWSEIALDDPLQVLAQARSFGLRYGLAVSLHDDTPLGQRSFGLFARADREFDDSEVALLTLYLTRRHEERMPPSNLTAAELEALRMVKDGQRVKQIAHELGVSEGAVKQRLKNAKRKLNAATSAQAATMATEFGLI
ncbi:transcriptional regulator, LuxR family protein [Oceanicola granulosus HTCC2516]|uniref:Transcriptional regulator, LuxR family protein n=1 Tax=Oceanicola granulosus (strain ATCC BAA-861 / DSM 15982 / KCTC 12143 / HTCC2516) TaxID=314256 RepID=Q2CHR6_OCEGH|nr:autoinducer binding domain-containing protein [Oceanicola granulosus]EAR52228.1 transcriptional regulator, LuxR family protein [Oceanicola granulosus HTCC2516]